MRKLSDIQLCFFVVKLKVLHGINVTRRWLTVCDIVVWQPRGNLPRLAGCYLGLFTVRESFVFRRRSLICLSLCSICVTEKRRCERAREYQREKERDRERERETERERERLRERD